MTSQEQWKKIEKAIIKLNDRSHFRKPNRELDKLAEEFERLDKENHIFLDGDDK